MSTTSAQLLEQVENPERLEEMYQNDPTGFRVSLKEASTKAPDSLVLRAWTARLKRGEETAPKKEKGDTLWIAIAIAVAVGLLFRLPSNWLDATPAT